MAVVFEYRECSRCHSVFLADGSRQPGGIYTKEYFAATDGDAGLMAKFERGWQALLHRRRLCRAPVVWKGLRVLDVGCGTGCWLKFLQAHGCEGTGLDPSEEACRMACGRGAPNVVCGDLLRHPLQPRSFDVVMAIHVLEHCADPVAALRELVHLVKPGGWLNIAVPNIMSWEARRAGSHWYHLDPPYHLCLPSPAGMERLLAEEGVGRVRVIFPVLEYCQSVLYAALGRRSVSRKALLSLLPAAVFGNFLLARMGRSGVVEFWGCVGDRSMQAGQRV